MKVLNKVIIRAHSPIRDKGEKGSEKMVHIPQVTVNKSNSKKKQSECGKERDQS